MGPFLRHGHFISSFGFHYIVSTLSVCQDLIPVIGLKSKVKKFYLAIEFKLVEIFLHSV